MYATKTLTEPFLEIGLKPLKNNHSKYKMLKLFYFYTQIFAVSFTELSEDTCLLMDWGDGDSNSLYANDPACSAKHANLPIEGN